MINYSLYEKSFRLLQDTMAAFITSQTFAIDALDATPGILNRMIKAEIKGREEGGSGRDAYKLTDEFENLNESNRAMISVAMHQLEVLGKIAEAQSGLLAQGGLFKKRGYEGEGMSYPNIGLLITKLTKGFKFPL